jgi:hypothetical protein
MKKFANAQPIAGANCEIFREQARWPLRVQTFDDFQSKPAATRAPARGR